MDTKMKFCAEEKDKLLELYRIIFIRLDPDQKKSILWAMESFRPSKEFELFQKHTGESDAN